MIHLPEFRICQKQLIQSRHVHEERGLVFYELGADVIRVPRIRNKNLRSLDCERETVGSCGAGADEEDRFAVGVIIAPGQVADVDGERLAGRLEEGTAECQRRFGGQ